MRELLLLGLGLVAAGSLGSALSPSLAAFVVAQGAIGAAAALLLSAGVAAAGEWAAPDERSRVLSWALLGQPAAWVAGMPLIGVISQLDWRYAWLTVPLAASLVALTAVALQTGRPARRRDGRQRPLVRTRPVWRSAPVARWAIGELMAYSGWGATLVYAGALFIDSYGLSAAQAGVLLGGAALGYFPGTLPRASTWPGTRAPCSSDSVWLLPPARPCSGSCAPRRPPASRLRRNHGGDRRPLDRGQRLGLDAAPDQRVAVMSVRAAAIEFGYLLGAASGGAALAAGGYGLLGVTLGALFLLAVAPHLRISRVWTRAAAKGGRPAAATNH